ncbi:sigma-54-dependent Fis family transcriptional regulator [Alteromonas sp. KC3]|uniref:sigma-54-dependent transcriptional regulator n=1 Tax=unclassified Alteromonas TaxID=2614992 RepID=UPI001920F1E9|nr:MULTISPECIES: sigma-54 dependent transcriptional regulator [unclassified Alteromonas]BCO18292.1 sigma-54-dependent Fis family transcriptional regulator [Alteromonas sp. KC3]BCO22252.1 sigma-54-dependent Fis family transcriptional regulator [Alteromonas sp. KC14]
MTKILIVDDNTAVLEALSLLLEIHGYQIVTATSPKEALQIVNYQSIALVIQDMNFSADTTSGEEGRVLFSDLRSLNPLLPIILITAWTELEQAVELVKAGAADYIPKPWDDTKLVTTVNNLIALGQANTKNKALQQHANVFDTAKQAAQSVGLVYDSAAMQRVVDMALQVAKSDVPVLITGPNGSGKEKIAELIQRQSPLNQAPFVKVNAGALPQELIEAELFGAEAGAFTSANKSRIGRFEAANGGTLFLDEIGNLPLSGQVKLLRVLQTGEFEKLGSVKTQRTTVRIISATNADLVADIAKGTFREDLFYRLNVIEINVPPLCERGDDALALVKHFLPGRELSLTAQQAITQHMWPGNVRELENACRRVDILYPEGVLGADAFGLTSEAKNTVPRANTTEPTQVEIEAALVTYNGVIAKVAKHFGLSRQALYRRLDKYAIDYKS